MPDPPIGPIDPGEERRDDLSQLHQHALATFARLAERVAHQPCEQRLVRLAGREDAHVAGGCCGQHSPQRVQRPGVDCPRPGLRGVSSIGTRVQDLVNTETRRGGAERTVERVAVLGGQVGMRRYGRRVWYASARRAGR